MKFSNTLRKGSLLVALLVMFAAALSAQRTIRGKVTDSENGEGLIGATVTVVGTTRGASTDIDGNYSVEIPANSTQLRVAYTGYTEQVVTLGTSNVVDIAMAAGSVLDEVVVVGYGTLKSREVTSSVATIKSADFNKGNINDAAQLLQGKVAGLSISRGGGDPNGTFSIRLRGLSTLGSNTSPLVVVDGIPNQSLSAIDPNDIESFDVLKDGSAAAIYGTRASSGVIIVTTKKGKAGSSSANYTGQFSIEQIERAVKGLSAADYVSFVPDAKNLGSQTNWLDEITRTGQSQLHSLNLSGGSNKTTYRATLSYRDIQGIAKPTGFNQLLGSLTLQQKALKDRLTLTANFNAVNRNANIGFGEAFRYATIYNPTSPIVDDKGKYVEDGGFELFNPVAIIEQNTHTRKSDSYFSNLRADLKIIDGLTFSTLVGRTRNLSKEAEFYSIDALYRSGRRGLAKVDEFNGSNDLIENTLNYEKSFGKASLKLLGGYSWQEFKNEGLGNLAGGVGVDNFGVDNLGAYTDFNAGLAGVYSYRNSNRLIAQFGRVNFGYDNTYYLTASLRREGSSRFGVNSKWGLFPSVSASVALDKFISSNFISSLKLRGGFGVTGATPREDYNSLAKVSPSGQAAFFGGAFVPAWGVPGTNPNPDLKWERKSDINVGIDFALADYKLTGSIEYYRATVSDLIFQIPVAQPAALKGETVANVGKLQSGGLELALTYNVNKNWSSTLVGTRYDRTRLLEFFRNFQSREFANVGAPGQNGVNYTVVSVQDSANINQLGNLVAVDVARLGEDGKYVYYDKDGNETTNKANARKVIAGNGIPKYELGWTNSFNFGHWDAQIFFRGVFGHSLANEFRAFYETVGDNNGFNKVDTKYFDPNNKDNNAYNSRVVEKANFVRLDNLTIGYRIPMTADKWFSNARVYFSGQQLFTFTNYSGVDPSPRFVDDGPVDNGGRAPLFKDPLAPGIDRRNTYFTTRTFTLGVNLGF